MGRNCVVCFSGKAKDVEAYLATGLSQEKVAAKFGLSRQNIRTHLAHSEIKKVVKAESLERTKQPDTLSELLKQRARLHADIERARENRDLTNALRFEGILQRNLDLEYRLSNQNNQPSEEIIEQAVKGHISSVVRFFLNKVKAYPEAETALREAVFKEFGISDNWNSSKALSPLS